MERERMKYNSQGDLNSSTGSRIMVHNKQSTTTRTRHRSSSPLSPYHVTRVQEKEHLQNLNDRLAAYIDKVRRLEDDNAKLQTVVSTYTETQEREVKRIKSMYDEELGEARRTLDQLAKERAKFEIESGKYKCDAEEAINKLSRKERELRQLDNHVKVLENENSELKARNENLSVEMGRRANELQELRKSLPDLERQLAKARKQLEDETLLRVDLENQNLSLKEELQFKCQMHQQELDQVRSEKRIEIQEVDERIKEEYDNRLITELNQIRSDTEAKINEMREEVEACYERKLQDAEEAVQRGDAMLLQIREDLAAARSRLADLTEQKNALQRKCAADEDQIRKLEDKLSDAQQKLSESEAVRDDQLRKIRDEYNNLCVDYQSLLDVKISLDQEISAYRKLLESEEERLQLNAPLPVRSNAAAQRQADAGQRVAHFSRTGSAFTTEGLSAGRPRPGSSILTRASKKRRMEESEEESKLRSSFSSSSMCRGAVEIIEEDNEHGSYITVYNNSDSPVNIGGWTVRRLSKPDGRVVEFRFPPSTVLRKSASSVIWAAKQKQSVHSSPPDSFVMTGQEWPVSEHTISYLLDQSGEEMSTRESTRTVEKSQLSRGTISRTAGQDGKDVPIIRKLGH